MQQLHGFRLAIIILWPPLPPTDLTVVKADPLTGQVSPEDVVMALRSSTRLVSVMLANNETGVIQPVQGVVRAVREWWESNGGTEPVFLHTDAAQVRSEELGLL